MSNQARPDALREPGRGVHGLLALHFDELPVGALHVGPDGKPVLELDAVGLPDTIPLDGGPEEETARASVPPNGARSR